LAHAEQLLAHDFVVDHRGNRCPLPKYYDRLLERIDAGRMSELKAERARKASINLKDSTYDRLAVREEYAELMAQRVSRELM